jgi:hypothetical protein
MPILKTQILKKTLRICNRNTKFFLFAATITHQTRVSINIITQTFVSRKEQDDIAQNALLAVFSLFLSRFPVIILCSRSITKMGWGKSQKG